MNFTKMTEEDVKYQFITPAIEDAGWNKNQLKFEYSFTDGEMQIRGSKSVRGAKKRADYILLYKPNLPLAIVEAKDMYHAVGDGMQQGVEYAKILDIPFVYSSNGKSFLERDRLNGTEREMALNEFPSPDELWERYTTKEFTPKQEEIITQPYYFDSFSKKSPRYYQRVAINRTIEAIAQGKERILLVMATGTGKTFTAFQIAHRLKESGLKKKILYLADRNILIDQTMVGDFKPFDKVMTKIQNKELDSAYEIYFALYQQLVDEDENKKQPYHDLDSEFFDLIIVDECHRGSAKEDSQWRRILEYFNSATQIGMTATPKEDKHTSNIGYFGEPLYTYSLKDGIEDGFLAPFRVIKVGFDKDLYGYRPEKGKIDSEGNEVEDRIYNSLDFDKTVVMKDRTRKVAKRITKFLKATDRYAKTIVFCVDTEHADRMRQELINENSDIVKHHENYIMRITGNDEAGKKQLDYFMDVDEKYPTIVTTSKLLTTGVDCKTCKLIVLDTNVGSMTEFKQIIGRGTRLRPDKNKNFFTIMDFRNNTRKFADPEWDGPIKPYDGPIGKSPKKPTKVNKPKHHREKQVINGVKFNIVLQENRCYDSNGKLITENLIEYTQGRIKEEYKDLGEFLNKWTSGMKREAIINELYEHDIFIDELREVAGKPDMDDFDLICHIAFDKEPLTRQERANNVKKRGYLNKYDGIARDVIEVLLDKYATDGIEDLESIKILDNDPFREMGKPSKIVKAFGGKDNFLTAMGNLQRELYV